MLYVLSISVDDIKPKIKRDVVVDGSMTLNQLHKLIQSIYGLRDYHMWHFGGYDKQIAKNTTIHQLINSGMTERGYTYDYGDNREMNIKLNRKLKIDESRTVPYVLKYQGPMLMEDVGGPWGYSDLLIAYQAGDKKSLENMGRENAKELKAIMDDIFGPVHNDKNYNFVIPQFRARKKIIKKTTKAKQKKKLVISKPKTT